MAMFCHKGPTILDEKWIIWPPPDPDPDYLW